nr:probable protein S-acyltransferase 16 [Tanacetum cinerariifolium]
MLKTPPDPFMRSNERVGTCDTARNVRFISHLVPIIQSEEGSDRTVYIISGLLLIPLSMALGVFLGWHIYLTVQNKTTIEVSANYFLNNRNNG